MWIMNQAQTILTNTETENRFTITKKEDAVLIHFGEHVVGRYFTEHEARKVLTDLAEAIDKENLYFEFPRSLNQDTLERKRDVRTKRKGGS